MKTFEVIQIAVKKRVFVVPFDFESNRTFGKALDVIDLVRDGFPLDTVHYFLDFEPVFSPTMFDRQSSPHTLGSSTFPSTSANKLLNGYLNLQ